MVTTMVVRRMDLTDITVHAFRSAFRDGMAECTEFPNEVIEVALTHVINNEAEAIWRRCDLLEKDQEVRGKRSVSC